MSNDETINTGAVTRRLRALASDAPLAILIVDDDELERALIGDRLSVRGLEVTQATSGLEALSALKTRSFPVVLIDWQMPEMDGIELTERLRAEGLEDTYLIMLTARDSEFDFERGYLAGVDDYLTKKVHEAELLARVHAGFNTYALRRELREARAALAAATASKKSAG